MSTKSQTPSFGDDNQECDALQSAVEAAFGPGAFALMSDDDEIATCDESILPDSAASQEASHRSCDNTGNPSDQNGRRKYVLFELADKLCAVAIENVREIQPVPPIASLLGVPAWLCGIANLRGAILSVVDLGRFLGWPPAEGSRKMIVVRSLADDLTAGLIVQRVVGIRALDATLVNEPDSLKDCGLRFVQGRLADPTQTCLFLDLDELLLSGEFRDLNAD